MISLINNSTRDRLKLTAFNYIDVKDSRPDTDGIVIINDSQKTDISESRCALNTYGITSFGWSSEKKELLDLLVA